MNTSDSHTSPVSTVFLGAHSRVAQLVAGYWAKDTVGGGNLLRIARGAGADLAWDMATPVPPLPPGTRPGAVFCFAGVTPKRAGEFGANRALALATIDAARVWGAAHCFVLSSSAVYGNPGGGAVCEDTAPRPTSPYGAAKLDMEQAALAAAPRGVTILRLANIAGAGEPFDSAARPVPPSLPLHRFADGTGPVRSFISPRALAQVMAHLARLATDSSTLPPVLNVAAPRPTAMADILITLGRQWHWEQAPETAIRTVHLNTARLSALCPLPDEWASARHLVADLPKDTTQP